MFSGVSKGPVLFGGFEVPFRASKKHGTFVTPGQCFHLGVLFFFF